MAIQFDNTNTGVATLKPASSGTLTLTLPAADGTSGQAITTNGSGQLAFSTVGGGGLTGFTAAESTAAPNATVYVDSLTASATSTNADVAFVAKGTGATLAQVPDSTATGGNKRGVYATDFQKFRAASTNVASGTYSVIVGGASNVASGNYSFVGGGGDAVTATNRNTASGTQSSVVGGTGNVASNSYAFVGGGFTNTASGTASVVVGGGYDFGGAPNTNSGYAAFIGAGISNTLSGKNAAIVGGDGNSSNGQSTFIGAGRSNTANSDYSFVGGGRNNTASGFASSIAGGFYGNTRSITGFYALPACNAPIASATGVSQAGLLVLGVQTTNATATVLRSDVSAATTTNQVILPNNSAYYFRGECIAGVTGAGDTKGWYIEGVIKRGANAASTAIVGTASVTSLYADTGAATWAVTATADTTNGGLAITVTGQAATTIRWVCQIRTTEMTY